MVVTESPLVPGLKSGQRRVKIRAVHNLLRAFLDPSFCPRRWLETTTNIPCVAVPTMVNTPAANKLQRGARTQRTMRCGQQGPTKAKKASGFALSNNRNDQCRNSSTNGISFNELNRLKVVVVCSLQRLVDQRVRMHLPTNTRTLCIWEYWMPLSL